MASLHHRILHGCGIAKCGECGAVCCIFRSRGVCLAPLAFGAVLDVLGAKARFPAFLCLCALESSGLVWNKWSASQGVLIMIMFLSDLFYLSVLISSCFGTFLKAEIQIPLLPANEKLRDIRLLSLWRGNSGGNFKCQVRIGWLDHAEHWTRDQRWQS